YNDPKIAVAVYVENAGFGAAYGVPIGSLIMEKYLNGEISEGRKHVEERMLNSNTIVSSGVKKH
ncbi:MAG: penicillin-binding protein 2, partial [Muribaculaceae bacterium]|nr:penicillin-binding protein 2 [Muribaculaceae bacterium]